MTQTEFLKLLREGKVSFRGETFTGEFNFVPIINIEFFECSFEETLFTSVTFESCPFISCNLSGSFFNCNFGAYMQFKNCNFKNALFKDCTFSKDTDFGDSLSIVKAKVLGGNSTGEILLKNRARWGVFMGPAYEFKSDVEEM